jgi:hypothetical protein
MSCPECQLTPAAADLMRRALADMQRTRAEDPAWRPLICGRCGEVTGIVDDRDRWVFGMEPRAAAVPVTAATVATA